MKPEGVWLHRVLKSTSRSARQKKALSQVLAGVPKAHAKTIKNLTRIGAQLVARPKVMKGSKQLKQFVKNQKYAVARASAGSAGAKRALEEAGRDASRGTLSTACPRTGRPCVGFDLRSTVVAPPDVVKGIPVLQQGVVDFLYAALSDFQQFMKGKFAQVQWCVTWGTLLGVHRMQGLIPWDCDVDVAVILSDAEEFKSAILPELIHFMKAKGHKLYVMPEGLALKIGPKSCPDLPANLSLFTEVKHRLSETSRHRGVRLPRSSLCQLAKQQLSNLPAMKTHQLRAAALGPHVIDVELIFRQHNGVCKFHGYDIEVQKLKVDSGSFGPLTVPVPVSGAGRVAPILKAMYPGGFRQPVFRHWITGRTYPVPNIPRLRQPLLPSAVPPCLRSPENVVPWHVGPALGA